MFEYSEPKSDVLPVTRTGHFLNAKLERGYFHRAKLKSIKSNKLSSSKGLLSIFIDFMFGTR
jgi:hypothetical protein